MTSVQLEQQDKKKLPDLAEKTKQEDQKNTDLEQQKKAAETAEDIVTAKKENTGARYEMMRRVYLHKTEREAQEKQAVQQEAHEKTPDKETVAALNSIDPKQKTETPEAKRNISTLKAVSLTLVPRLLNNNFKTEDLSDLSKLTKLPPLDESKLSTTENLALKKLKEIALNQEGFYFQTLQKEWSHVVQWVVELKPAIDYGTAFFKNTTVTPTSETPSTSPFSAAPFTSSAAIKSSPSSPSTINTTPSPSATSQPESKGILDTIKEFTSEHPKLILGIIGLAGAYGVYKLWSSPEKESESTSEDGPLDKVFTTIDKLKYPLLLGVSGLFIAGALVGKEGMLNWIKDKLPNFSWESIKEFLNLLVHGHPIDAIKTLWTTPDENTPVHQEIAKMIKKESNVDIKTLTFQEIGKRKLSDFIAKKGGKGPTGIAESIQNELKDKAKSTLGPLKDLPAVGSALNTFLGSDTTQEDTQEITAIKNFLTNHADSFKDKAQDKLTVNDAFRIILHLPALPQPSTEKASSDTDLTAPPPVPRYNPEQKIEVTAENQYREHVKAALNTAASKLDTAQKKSIFQEFFTELEKRWLDTNEINEILKLAQTNNVSITAINKLLLERTQKLNLLLEALRSNSTREDISKKQEDLLETNEELGDKLNDLKNETMRKTGWDEAKYLAVVQAPFFLTRYLRTPRLHREYAKYLLGKFTVGTASSAFEAGKDAYKKITKPEVSLAELETEIKSLEETHRRLEEAKKRYSTADGKDLEAANDYEKLKKNHDFRNADLVGQDLEIAKKTHAVKLKETEVATLKTQLSTANPGGPYRSLEEKIKSLEEAVLEEKATLEGLKNKRLSLKNEQLKAKISFEHHDLKERIGKGKNVGEIHKADFDRVDGIMSEIDDHRKNLQDEIASKFAKAEKLAAGSAEQKQLIREIVQLQETAIDFNIRGFDTAEKVHKKWRTDWDNFWALSGKGEEPEARKYLQSEQAKLKRWFNQVLGTASQEASAEKAASKPMISTFKGNIIFYGALIGAGSYLNYDAKKGNYWASLEQSAIDVFPVTGTISDFYSAIEGKEYFTGHTLGTGDRAIRGVLGGAGALCDIASIAGLGLLGRRALTAVKEMKAVGKSVTMKELLDVARAEGKTIESLEAIKFMRESGKWGFKVGLAGALGLAGYGLIYQPMASRTLSPETQALLSDQLQETNLEPPTISSPFQTAG